MNPISLVLFEDNDRLRESLVFLLKNTEGFSVLADYNNCNDAASAMRIYKPDVVLMDIDMPGKTGVEGVRMVKEAMPFTAVIMFTVFEDEDKLFECLCAGANGYMLKKTPPGKLFEAIQEVKDGGAPMSPSIARK
ncbi:MAG TPA: response regulator transcription factor, partial [Mucilaginibacter sp.]